MWLVCWCASVLVCWCAGVLICWCTSDLLLLCVGLSVCLFLCLCLSVFICFCVCVFGSNCHLMLSIFAMVDWNCGMNYAILVKLHCRSGVMCIKTVNHNFNHSFLACLPLSLHISMAENKAGLSTWQPWMGVTKVSYMCCILSHCMFRPNT